MVKLSKIKEKLKIGQIGGDQCKRGVEQISYPSNQSRIHWTNHRKREPWKTLSKRPNNRELEKRRVARQFFLPKIVIKLIFVDIDEEERKHKTYLNFNFCNASKIWRRKIWIPQLFILLFEVLSGLQLDSDSQYFLKFDTHTFPNILHICDRGFSP